MTTRAKTFWTIAITGLIAIALPVALVKLVRLTMAPLITRDNAGVVFTQFQVAINQGSSIRDSITAAAVATQAYRDKTSAVLLDGWGHRMNVYADVNGSSCQLNVKSAGPDGNFGTADDVIIPHAFDLTPVANPVKKPDEPEQN